MIVVNYFNRHDMLISVIESCDWIVETYVTTTNNKCLWERIIKIPFLLFSSCFYLPIFIFIFVSNLKSNFEFIFANLCST